VKVSDPFDEIVGKRGATKVWCASEEVRGRVESGAILKSKLARF